MRNLRWLFGGLWVIFVGLTTVALMAIRTPSKSSTVTPGVLQPSILADVALAGGHLYGESTVISKRLWENSAAKLHKEVPQEKTTIQAGFGLASSSLGLGSRQERFLTSMRDMVSVLDDQLAPSIRPNQPNAYIRLRILLKVHIEAATYTNRMCRYILTREDSLVASMRTDEQKLRQFPDIYRKMAYSPVEKDAIERVSKLLASAFADAHDIIDLTAAKTTAWEDFSRSLEPLAASSGSSPNSNRMRDVGIFVVLLALAGLALTLVAGRFILQRYILPLREMNGLAEAAVTGDLSRELEFIEHEELGPLASSMNRMLDVIRRSEQLIYQLATLVDSAGDAIIGINLDGTVLTWNKGAEKIYGYSTVEMRGHSFLKLLPEDRHGELASVLKQLQSGATIEPFETIHLRKDGQFTAIILHLSAIRDSKMKIIGVSLLCRDITDRRRLEQERDRLQTLSDSLMAGRSN